MRGISVFLIAGLLGADTGTALSEYQLGHLKAAEAAARDVLKQHPQDWEAKSLLAMIRAGEGDCAGQQTALQSAWRGGSRERGSTIGKLAGLAAVQCAITEEHPASGVAVLQELQQEYPTDADVLYLGARLYMKGWNAQVAEMFAKAPASYRVNQLSGEIFETQGNFTEAASEYAKAIAKKPPALNLHFRRGRVLLLASHDAATLELARQEFEAELALNAEDAAAVYQLGQISEAQGNRSEAAKRFEQATSLSPNFAEALLALAKLRIRERRTQEGVQLLERTVALQPANETAHYNLMLAYRSEGRAGEAAKEKATLDHLQKPPGGEFSDFLKKLGEKPVQP